MINKTEKTHINNNLYQFLTYIIDFYMKILIIYNF